MDIQLEVVGSSRGSVRWELSRGALRMGRGPGNDLILTDGQVSTHHAVVALIDGRPMLSDLRSTNGTSLNGKRIQRAVPLAHGDVVGLGPKVHLIVELASGDVGEALLVEDPSAGLRLALGRLPVRVGAHSIELVAVSGSRATCRVDGQRRELEIDRPVQLGETELVLRRPGGLAPTVRAGRNPIRSACAPAWTARPARAPPSSTS
jgi:hypothetical protein